MTRLDEIIRRVPAIPTGATDEFDLGPSGLLSAADRRLLRYLIRTALPDVPAELYVNIRNVGDLRALLDQYGGGRGVDVLQRGVYATDLLFMRPVMRDDMEQLYLASLDPSNSFRWRFRGHTVSIDEFIASLSNGVLAQFCLCSRKSGQVVTFVSAYNYDSTAHHCTFALQRIDFDGEYSTSVAETCLLFLTYLFTTFGVRKVFADIPEYNYALFGLLQGVFELECEKRDVYWHGGQFWSERTISVNRETWNDFVLPLFASGERESY